jgi:hypothetical protein
MAITDRLSDAVALAGRTGKPAKALTGGVTREMLAETRGGWDGTTVSSGEVLDRDFNPDLDTHSWRGEWGRPGVVDRMIQSEPTIQGVNLIRRNVIASAEFSVEPASDQPRDVEIAEFVEAAIIDGLRTPSGQGWRSFLAEACEYDLRGARYYEVTYQRDRQTGRVGLGEVSPRPLKSVDYWLPDGRGGWDMQQYVPYSDDRRGGTRAPVVKSRDLLKLRWNDTSSNPEPVPMLRPCYGPFIRRDIAAKARTHGFERYAYAVPLIRVDPHAPGFDPSETTQAAARRIAATWRVNLNAAAQMPIGYELEFVEVQFDAASLLDAEQRDGREIASALGAGWYHTGWDNGTEALYREQFASTFVPQLQSNAHGIAEAIQRQIVPQLVRLNFGDADLPKFRAGRVQTGDPLRLAQAASSALQSGAVVDYDGSVEAGLRHWFALPPMPADVRRRKEEEAAAEPEPPAPPPEPPAEPADEPDPEPAHEDEPEPVEEPEEAPLAEVLAERMASLEARAFGDILTQRPDGAPATELEGVLRLSETALPVDSAKARLVSTIDQWRAGMVDEYARQVAAAPDMETAGRVPLPNRRSLEEAYVGTLESVYETGKTAATRETQRQRANPELRQRIEQGLERPEPDEPSALSEIDLTPPKGAQEAAARALRVRAEKPPSQRGMTPVGLARARDLSNGSAVSVETVRRMKAYFDRHEVDKQGETWADKGKGWQAWHGWGGDAGRTWANAIVKRLDAGTAASETACGCGSCGPHIQRWTLAELAEMGHALNGVACLAEAPEPDAGLPESIVDSIDPDASIRTVTQTSVTSLSQRIQRAVRQALQAASVGGSMESIPDVGALVKATVLGLSLGQESSQAQGDVATLFGLGRAQQQRAEGIKRYQYTTMLESARCDPCISHDLEVFDASELDVYATPASWCLGGDKCNCINIGIVE